MIVWQNFQSMICVGAVANRMPMDQECSLYMTTDLGPIRATLEKNVQNEHVFLSTLLFVFIFDMKSI